MIEIITVDGQSLDLSPGCEFEIEMEQPMLSSDHVPVAFSTSISFPPSKANCLAFEYLPGLMVEPSKKEIAVSIVVDGIMLMCGILCYDGEEDGELQYCFSGRDLEEEWKTKIWQAQFSGYTKTPNVTWPSFGTAWFNRLKKGDDPRIKLPNLINKSALGHASESAYKTDFALAHQNLGLETVLTPVFMVNKILEKTFSAITLDEEISDIYDTLCLIAQYKPDGIYGKSVGVPSDYDLQQCLPDITIYDLVINLSKILCLSLYREGTGSYKLLLNQTVLADDTTLDWSSKVHDLYSASKESPQAYVFGYNDKNEDNVFDPETVAKESVPDVYSLPDVYTSFKKGSSTVRVLPLGDVYSGKSGDLYTDIVYHNNPPIDMSSEVDGDSYDASTDFCLVRCVVENGVYDLDPGPSPVIDSPPLGEVRGKDVFVGLFDPEELFMAEQTGTASMSQTEQPSLSLRTQSLYENYHKGFAKWLAKDRQVVSCELNLSLMDIAEFRMYRKVAFKGRIWIVKKLSVVFHCSDNTIAATGEFISM